MNSAVLVAQSLRYNRTLQTLGLAHNSFSDYASQVLCTPERNIAVCRDRDKIAFPGLLRMCVWGGSFLVYENPYLGLLILKH